MIGVPGEIEHRATEHTEIRGEKVRPHARAHRDERTRPPGFLLLSFSDLCALCGSVFGGRDWLVWFKILGLPEHGFGHRAGNRLLWIAHASIMQGCL